VSKRAVLHGPPASSFPGPERRRPTFAPPEHGLPDAPQTVRGRTVESSRARSLLLRPLTAAACGAVLALGSAAVPRPLAAQGYNAHVRTGLASVELRPLVEDSVPEATVAGQGLLRRLPDGTVVTCITGDYCHWYGSGRVRSLTTVTQEIQLAAWPGIRGLAFHAHLRGWYGSDGDWPLSSHRLEAMTAYLSYDIDRFHLQAGRQDRYDALGYRNFDGLSARWNGLDPFSFEAYGGWYLAPNLDAPLTSSLVSDAEPLAPDDRGLVFGGRVQAHAGRRISGSATYQRVIRTDRLALYSERVAAAGQALIGKATVDVSGRYDLSFLQFDRLRGRVTYPILPDVRVTAQVRHYRPYFPLWTIWGAFSPVGYDGGSGSVSWRIGELGMDLDAGGGYRWYEDSNTAGGNLAGLEDTGWHAFGGASWAMDRWFAKGSYRADIGPGAADMGGDLTVGRRFGQGTWLAVRGTSTRTFGEYRLGDQRLAGADLTGSASLGELSLTGSAGLYRLSYTDRPAIDDWTQFRMYLALGYHFGSTPSVESVLGEGYGR